MAFDSSSSFIPKEAFLRCGRRNTYYMRWYDMRRRCTDPSRPHAHRYVNRGISICECIFEFEDYVRTLYPLKPGTSLDRVNNDGHYCACGKHNTLRWATPSEQMRNSSHARIITHNCVSLMCCEWSKLLGGNRFLVSKRLHRGWDEVRAVTTPAKRRRSK